MHWVRIAALTLRLPCEHPTYAEYFYPLLGQLLTSLESSVYSFDLPSCEAEQDQLPFHTVAVHISEESYHVIFLSCPFFLLMSNMGLSISFYLPQNNHTPTLEVHPFDLQLFLIMVEES